MVPSSRIPSAALVAPLAVLALVTALACDGGGSNALPGFRPPTEPPGPAVDTDRDGTPDSTDNCPAVSNPGQSDADADGRGDACDNCLETPNPDQADLDRSGFGDACEGVMEFAFSAIFTPPEGIGAFVFQLRPTDPRLRFVQAVAGLDVLGWDCEDNSLGVTAFDGLVCIGPFSGTVATRGSNIRFARFRYSYQGFVPGCGSLDFPTTDTQFVDASPSVLEVVPDAYACTTTPL